MDSQRRLPHTQRRLTAAGTKKLSKYFRKSLFREEEEISCATRFGGERQIKIFRVFVSEFPSVFCFSHARFSTKMESALQESFGVFRSAGKPASTLFAM